MNCPTRKETLKVQGLFSCYIALWRDGLQLFTKDTAFEIANAVGSIVYEQAGQAEKERDRAQYAVDPGDPDAAGGGSADSLLRGKGPGARAFAGGNCQINIMCITGGEAKFVLRPCFFQWVLVQYY